MFGFRTKLPLVVRSRLMSPASLEAENLLLRQQVIVPSPKFLSSRKCPTVASGLTPFLTWRLEPTPWLWPDEGWR